MYFIGKFESRQVNFESVVVYWLCEKKVGINTLLINDMWRALSTRAKGLDKKYPGVTLNLSTVL